ncbi:MAG TPA: dihydroorotate dehydrogenase electron transfer subunit [Povalibacter sp.]|uniref:dihydroorotate dehydrogenase electron transfer subunit n=1 Tax=Povalibacter sp. TaxID=1962978 RepID=UPI002C68F8F0|nr:dihydroorotate dehydrogenase electron transfer subunit [Povalibacter sp.]HMN46979.1 dihydroorotate dehydrogenase electron transfer subunit [Povalibacter sp.]
MNNPSKPHRGTIFLEDAEVVAQTAFDANQFVLKLKAPKCAATAQPGSFVHLTCDESLPMRRPLSIMRVDAQRGTVEVLYKIVGHGLHLLSAKKAGDRISTLGPIGNSFVPHPGRPRTLLVGGGVGIPPMVFLAEALRERSDADWKPLVLMGSEVPFPFRSRPSTILVPGMPEGAIACMPLLDEWGVPSRLASLAGYPGCFDGYVTDLAAAWLGSLDRAALAQVEIFACGPTVMLTAAAAVAKRFDIPCQVSLEEFMACAVGGCAGCAVKVATPNGPAMKRVCVDGPVFDAAAVFNA